MTTASEVAGWWPLKYFIQARFLGRVEGSQEFGVKRIPAPLSERSHESAVIIRQPHSIQPVCDDASLCVVTQRGFP